jgi:hypothetical protein
VDQFDDKVLLGVVLPYRDAVRFPIDKRELLRSPMVARLKVSHHLWGRSDAAKRGANAGSDSAMRSLKQYWIARKMQGILR